MSSPETGRETQLKDIQAKTSKTLDELTDLVRHAGLTRHGEIRAMLQRVLGLGDGGANSLTLYILRSDAGQAGKEGGMTGGDVLDEVHAGAKAALRPIHERLMAAIVEFGPFGIAPKRGYVSPRCKKQFAMIGPAANTRVEVGINVKGLEPHGRLLEQPAGSMGNYKVRLTAIGEVDAELIAWIRKAYDAAG